MPATLADIQRKYGDSVYPLYKDEMHAPYMENDNGIGYKGVVLYDEHEDKVQCAECGGWFKLLSSHIKVHQYENTDQYKDAHGLFRKVALCSKNDSATRRRNVSDARRVGKMGSWYADNLTGIKATSPEYKKATRSKTKKIQYKNQFGLCDAQIAARLVVVKEELGKDSVEQLTSSDIERLDKNLLSCLCYKYGNWELACNALGLKNVRGGKSFRIDDAHILAELRQYVRAYKKIPTSTTANRNLIANSVRHFGSWRRAKMMAGLDQLLAEIKQ